MKKNIHPTSLIITGVAVILIVIALINAKHHPLKAPFIPAVAPATIGTTTTTPTTTPTTVSASVCYILNSPTATGGANVAYLKIISSDGTHATGELGTFLDEKDGMSGTLDGTLTTDSTGAVVFDGNYTNEGEGMNSVNKQMIKISENQAQIGYGDPVTYSLTLPAVDCGQYQALKTATGH